MLYKSACGIATTPPLHPTPPLVQRATLLRLAAQPPRWSLQLRSTNELERDVASGGRHVRRCGAEPCVEKQVPNSNQT